MLAPEGRFILFSLLIITLIAGMIGFYYDSERLVVCFAVFGLLFLFSCNFFRDPARSIQWMNHQLLLLQTERLFVLIK